MHFWYRNPRRKAVVRIHKSDFNCAFHLRYGDSWVYFSVGNKNLKQLIKLTQLNFYREILIGTQYKFEFFVLVVQEDLVYKKCGFELIFMKFKVVVFSQVQNVLSGGNACQLASGSSYLVSFV